MLIISSNYKTMAKFVSSNKLEKSILSRLQVLINTDDGEEDYDTTWYPNGYASNQISIGHDGTGSNDGAFRFLRSVIPNNAKIVKAVIRIKSAVNSTKRPVFLIKGLKEANSNTFAAGARPSARTKTTATVAWTPGADWALNTWYESPDIKAIIDEIIKQDEYTGKALGIVIEDNSSPSNNYENIYDFNSGAANVARLVLTLAPNIN